MTCDRLYCPSSMIASIDAPVAHPDLSGTSTCFAVDDGVASDLRCRCERGVSSRKPASSVRANPAAID